MVWLMMKPSRHTMTGSSTSLCSPMRNAWTHRVVDFLAVFAVQLDPAGIAEEHRVAMVAADVDRRADRPVDHRHHHRQPRGGGDGADLGHQQQPLRRGGRDGPRPGRRRAETGALGAVLRFDQDQFRVHHAVVDV